MIVGHLTYDKLVEILGTHGWRLASDDYWNDYDRIIFEKDGENIVLQYKKVYQFPFVVKFLQSLDIEPPGDCLRPFEQLQEYKRRKAEGTDEGDQLKSGTP